MLGVSRCRQHEVTRFDSMDRSDAEDETKYRDYNRRIFRWAMKRLGVPALVK